jgi:hypothetical protein
MIVLPCYHSLRDKEAWQGYLEPIQIPGREKIEKGGPYVMIGCPFQIGSFPKKGVAPFKLKTS